MNNTNSNIEIKPEPKKRKNNSKEYNRIYWHKMRVDKGKWDCPCCNVSVDFVGKAKHINGIKHRCKTDPEFNKKHKIDLLTKRIEKLKTRLNDPENEKN